MTHADSHLLMLGCPFGRGEASLRAVARLPGWEYLGDLHLSAAETAGELQQLLTHSQDHPPSDLIDALDRCYPNPAATGEARLAKFLSLRADWSTRQLMANLLSRIAPKRALFLETEGCLRLQTLERWLDFGIPLHIVHLVDSPEAFDGRAREILSERLFVAPDYRSRTGVYPILEPLLAWYRIHHNIETLLAALPPTQWSRLRVTDLPAEDKEPAVLQALWGGSDPSARPTAVTTRQPDVAALSLRYGV